MYARAGLQYDAENAPRLLESDQLIDLTSSLMADTFDLGASMNMAEDWRFALAPTAVGAEAQADQDAFEYTPNSESDRHRAPLTSLGLAVLAVHGG